MYCKLPKPCPLETLVKIEKYTKINTIFRKVIKNTSAYRHNIFTHHFFFFFFFFFSLKKIFCKVLQTVIKMFFHQVFLNVYIFSI